VLRTGRGRRESVTASNWATKGTGRWKGTDIIFVLLTNGGVDEETSLNVGRRVLHFIGGYMASEISEPGAQGSNTRSYIEGTH